MYVLQNNSRRFTDQNIVFSFEAHVMLLCSRIYIYVHTAMILAWNLLGMLELIVGWLFWTIILLAVTLYLHYVRLILTYVYCKLLPFLSSPPSLPSLPPSLPPFPPSLPLYTLPPSLSSFPLLCLTPLHSPLVSFPLPTSLPSLFPLAPPFSRSGSVAGLPATLGNGGHFLWGTPAQVGGPTWS